MLIKGLGLVDVAAGVILMFLGSLNFAGHTLAVFGLILLSKSALGLLKDFASWIDFLAGIIFLLSAIIGIPSFIRIILGLLLLQKGLFSFL